jgi:hypothetical protein
VKNCNTSAARAQQTTLVKCVTPTPLWSNPRGNNWAHYRETSQFRSLQLSLPADFLRGHKPTSGEAHFYFAPGEAVGKTAKRWFNKLHAHLADKRNFPTSIEIEFSSPSMPSIPESYKSSAIKWALSVCDTVLICIDRDRGVAEGEAHLVLAPLQVVFRCCEHDVETWVKYLSARTYGRHKVSIIHPHISVGRA